MLAAIIIYFVIGFASSILVWKSNLPVYESMEGLTDKQAMKLANLGAGVVFFLWPVMIILSFAIKLVR